MPTLAILFGIILDALGFYAFFGTGGTHLTALIPSLIGTLMLVCGVLALARPDARKHFMHVAATLGLIGTLGGLGRGLPKLLSTGEWSPAVTASILMGFVSLLFVALCVRSFILARKAMAKA